MTHEAVTPISVTAPEWKGTWDWSKSGIWMDYAFLLVSNVLLYASWFIRFYFHTHLLTHNREYLNAVPYVVVVACHRQ